jgi:hypothetical protein
MILNILVIKTVVSLPCLRLLLIIIKLMLSMLLIACKDSFKKVVKAITPANSLFSANAHSA